MKCQHPCLIPIRSQQVKICADCKDSIPWKLGDRKPVGWSVDTEHGQSKPNELNAERSKL